jgi:hypothetical protein
MNADLPPLALYLHMPWCVRKCPYCDFNSHQLKSRAPGQRLYRRTHRDFERELPLVAGRRIDTRIFRRRHAEPVRAGGDRAPAAGAAAAHRVCGDAEITLEANPGTIERGRFAGYRDAGINRVSLGAQSFSPRALERLGRIHTPDDTRRAVEELRAAGIANFNLDLMYALPEQTLEEAVADVAAACALGPQHISHYQLTLEPGTVFHARPPPLPDEDAGLAMQTNASGCSGRGLRAIRGVRVCAAGRALPPQPQLLAVRRLPRAGRRRARQAQCRAAFANLANRKAQAAARVSGSPARCARSDRRARWIRSAELPFEFMLNACGSMRALRSATSNPGPDSAPRSRVAAALENAGKRGLIEAVGEVAPDRARPALPKRPAGSFLA